jgi:hypothetical protein
VLRVRRLSIERITKSSSKGSGGDVHVRIAKQVRRCCAKQPKP